MEYGVPFYKGQSHCIDANYFKGGNITKVLARQSGQECTLPNLSQINSLPDGKSRTTRATGYKDGIRNLVGNGVDKRTCVAEPVCEAESRRYKNNNNQSTKGEGGTEQFYVVRTDGKTNALSQWFKKRPLPLNPSE